MHYSVLFYILIVIPSGSPDTGKLVPHPEYIDNIRYRMIKGREASKNQFPYHISLLLTTSNVKRHTCSGAIISEDYVITAAHCLVNYGILFIVAGICNREEVTEDTQVRKVTGVIKHPGFPSSTKRVAGNDIVLLRLDYPLTWTNAVQPITLPSPFKKVTGTATLSGWGYTYSDNSDLPLKLKYIEKTIVSNEECYATLSKVLDDTTCLECMMLCTNGTKRVSVCGADSGSPLVRNNVLVGIASWAVSPCGTRYAPDVFVNVAVFVPWLLDSINGSQGAVEIGMESPYPRYVNNIDNRVPDGLEASRNQFPYIVSLYWSLFHLKKNTCAGTIVSASYVLTAAHCMVNYGHLSVIAGLLDRDERTRDTQKRNVTRIYKHPAFRNTDGVSGSDIAVLKLGTPLTWSKAVRPIKLPPPFQEFRGSVNVTGWGYTKSDDPEVPIKLQYIQKRIITQADCVKALENVTNSAAALDCSMLCTNGTKDVTICGGDSGSPLVQDGVLVGISSWSVNPCGTENAPDVFTKVSTFVAWIRDYTDIP